MGYLTRYCLSILDQDGYSLDSGIFPYVVAALRVYDAPAQALGEEGEYGLACEWESHEDDMKAFSRHFTKYVFILYGEGESNKDMWFKYFKNGKMQVAPAKIKFDNYDEKLLQ